MTDNYIDGGEIKMDNMYIHVTGEGIITDITNSKMTDNVVHVGVKYILGKDHIVFTIEGDSLYVSRYRGAIEIYKYQFIEPGDYMITTLFVEKYNAPHPLMRDVYTYLKSNLKGKFYLEEDEEMAERFIVSFSSWIDRSFCYRYKIKINPRIVTTWDIQELIYLVEHVNDMDLYAIHEAFEGQSFYIDEETIKLLHRVVATQKNQVQTIN